MSCILPRASGSVILEEVHLMSMVLLRHYSTVFVFTPWTEDTRG